MCKWFHFHGGFIIYAFTSLTINSCFRHVHVLQWQISDMDEVNHTFRRHKSPHLYISYQCYQVIKHMLWRLLGDKLCTRDSGFAPQICFLSHWSALRTSLSPFRWRTIISIQISSVINGRTQESPRELWSCSQGRGLCHSHSLLTSPIKGQWHHI